MSKPAPHEQGGPVSKAAPTVRAAIDLGTVTSRLMIGELERGGIQVLARDLVFTNLGEGLTASGRISSEATARLVAALQRFKTAIAQAAAERRLAAHEIALTTIATSALRDAANAREVLAAARECGIDIAVISGAREAELSFLGTVSGFQDAPVNSAAPVLTLDVGGGSTEFIIGTLDGRLDAARSFDIGCRRITELFFASDPPPAAKFSQAGSWVREHIAPFLAEHPQPQMVIGVAGTATTAITIRDGIEHYSHSLVHGKSVTLGQLQALLERLSALPLHERCAVRGLNPERAPVIIGGLVILVEALKVLQMNTLTVSDTDILEGVLLSELKI